MSHDNYVPPSHATEEDGVTHKILAWIFTTGIAGGLAWAFRAHGPFTVLLLLLYLAGLVATQLSVHWVVATLGFPYPSFLTLLQFLVLEVMLLLRYDRRILKIQDTATGVDMRLKSLRFVTFYMYKIAPIGAAMALCTAANNESLKLISPGLNAIIASMTPVFTGLISACCGVRMSAQAWVALLIATGGGFFTVQGALRDMGSTLTSMGGDAWKVLLGLFLAFGGMVLRAMKTVIIERAVRPSRSSRPWQAQYPVLTPTQTLVLQTPMVVAVSFLCALADPAGLKEPIIVLTGLLERPMLALGLIVNFAAAMVLQVLGLVIIRMLGATSMQLAGKFNIFIVMALSAAYTGEHIPMDEWAGALVILFAANMFTKAMKKHGSPSVEEVEAMHSKEGHAV